jgi:hypothetical protein
VTELLAIVSIEFSAAVGRFMGERAFVGVVEPTAAAAPGP